MHSTLAYLAFAITTVNFISYYYSVIGVFKKVPEMRMGPYRALQIGSVLVWVCALTALWKASAAKDWQLALIATVELLCLAIFWKHVGIVRANRFTITFSQDRPVKLVR